MAMQTNDRRWLAVVVSGIVLTLAGAAPAWTQQAAEAGGGGDDVTALQTEAAITPEAQAVLDRMQATFKEMKRYAVTANITRDEVLSFGYKLQHNELARMWVDEPTKLRVEIAGDVKNRTYVYDGAQLTVFAPDRNVYASTQAPSTLGELVRVLLDNGVEMPLIDLLYEGSVGSLTNDVRAGLVVGESEVDGVATDHLAFRQANIDWQLWVEKGPRALPRKLLITTRYEVGDPQYQAIIHWDLKPKLASKDFSFVPPAGATRIPYQSKLVADGGDK